MERHTMLKLRSESCCCRYCGGDLEVRLVVYNRYGGAGAELYCNHCMKIEFGTPKQIYRAAKKMVEDVEFNYFMEFEENANTEMLNVAKVCDLLGWCCKEWAIIDEQGFQLKLPGEVDKGED